MKKLRTHKLIKKRTFRNSQEKKFRRSLSSFRISTHRRGRYCGERPEERLCDFCNIIEDEIHFLCGCKRYLELRRKMFVTIKDINLRYPSLEHKFIFTTLMTSNDQIVIKAFVSSSEVTKIYIS